MLSKRVLKILIGSMLMMSSGLASHHELVFEGQMRASSQGKKIKLSSFKSGDKEGEGPLIFPLASVTKPVTSCIVLKTLYEQEISLSTPIQKYLPIFPLPDVTFSQCLSHTSGIGLYTNFNEPDFRRCTPLSRQVFFDMIQQGHVTPGLFAYNNGNYLILEAAIEAITKQSFAEVLQHSICESLGFKHMSLVKRTQEKPLVMGYTKQQKLALSIDYSWLGAGAGVATTIDEIHRFGEAFLAEQILLPALKETALKDQGGNYGYGWTLGKVGAYSVFWHEGGIDGFSTILMLEPTTQTVLTLLSIHEIEMENRAKTLMLELLMVNEERPA